MKKILSVFLITLFCMGVVLPAQAQLLQWGVKGGVNMTKIDWDGGNKDNMAGFFIGPMAQLNIPLAGLGVDAALLYSQKSIKADMDGVKQYGLDIPVNLKYTFGLGSILGIFVAAGPDFYFDFKGEKDGVERKGAKVSVNVGAGVKLVNHLQIGVNYNIPTGDRFSIGQAMKAKDKTWQVSLAYLF